MIDKPVNLLACITLALECRHPANCSWFLARMGLETLGL